MRVFRDILSVSSGFEKIFITFMINISHHEYRTRSREIDDEIRRPSCCQPLLLRMLEENRRRMPGYPLPSSPKCVETTIFDQGYVDAFGGGAPAKPGGGGVRRSWNHWEHRRRPGRGSDEGIASKRVKSDTILRPLCDRLAIELRLSPC